MEGIEKICKGCGKRFIIRKSEVYGEKWAEGKYCVLCQQAYQRKKQQEQEEKDSLIWAKKRAEKQVQFEKKIVNCNIINMEDITFYNDDVLYIIGNGFDLMHGVKSSYYAFRDSLGKHSNLREMLESFWTEGDIWADFEAGLAHFNVGAMANQSIVEDWLDVFGFFDDDAGAAEFYMAAEAAANPMETVASELPKRLRSWVETLQVRTDDRPLRHLIRNSKVLNFNYTEFIEQMYDVSMDNVCYIHGCRRKLKYHPKDKLIIGHRPGASNASYDFQEKKYGNKNYRTASASLAQDTVLQLIQEYDQELTKETCTIIAENSTFFEGLGAVKNIVVIGHSMSMVDWDYFKKITESVSNLKEVEWYIGCHGLLDLENLEELIKWIKLDETKVHIFRTDKIHVNLYAEKPPKPIMQNVRELAKSKGKVWSVKADKNRILIKDILSKTIVYEAVVKAEINRAVFTPDERGLLLISYAYPHGIHLLRVQDGQWEYVDELKTIPNQSIINRRLNKVFMDSEKVTFVYNSRIRKYSLKDGSLIYNKACQHALQKISSRDGMDVTEQFVKRNLI